jgi:hypothetical protein
VGVGVGVDVEAPKGFALAGCEEKGFADGVAVPLGLEEKGLEKGFADADGLPECLTPNSDSPILGWGFSSCLTSFFSGFGALDLPLAPLAIRTPRTPLTLPSFLLHVLRRQVQM